MARFRLTIEYVGTRYSGWQIQKNARSVQGEIARALCELRGDKAFELYGSGRTDSGVHALYQVAHLDCETDLTPARLAAELNERLPADINVLSLERASPRFHARHGAVGRSYLYQISRRRTAFAKPFVWWVKDALDVARMRAASGALLGLKDLRALTADDPEEKSTRVLISRIDVAEEGDFILIRVQGSHFLWKLVRRMVGLLVEVGRGNVAPADVPGLLQHSDRPLAQMTAPPSGLFLERVLYEGESFDLPLRAVMNVSTPATPAAAATPGRPEPPALRGPRPDRSRAANRARLPRRR